MVDYCVDCMTEARRIGAATGQNVSEVYRYYTTGTRHCENCGVSSTDRPCPCGCGKIQMGCHVLPSET